MLATAFRGVERSEGGGSVKVVGEGNLTETQLGITYHGTPSHY